MHLSIQYWYVNVCECITLNLKSFYSRNVSDRNGWYTMTTAIETTNTMTAMTEMIQATIETATEAPVTPVKKTAKKTAKKQSPVTPVTPVDSLRTIETVNSEYAHYVQTEAKTIYTEAQKIALEKQVQKLKDDSDMLQELREIKLQETLTQLHNVIKTLKALTEELETLGTEKANFEKLPTGLKNRLILNNYRQAIGVKNFGRYVDIIATEDVKSLHKLMTDYVIIEKKSQRYETDEKKKRGAETVKHTFDYIKDNLNKLTISTFKVEKGNAAGCKPVTTGMNSTYLNILLDGMCKKAILTEEKGNDSVKLKIVNVSEFRKYLNEMLYSRLNNVPYEISKSK